MHQREKGYAFTAAHLQLKPGQILVPLDKDPRRMAIMDEKGFYWRLFTGYLCDFDFFVPAPFCPCCTCTIVLIWLMILPAVNETRL